MIVVYRGWGHTDPPSLVPAAHVQPLALLLSNSLASDNIVTIGISINVMYSRKLSQLHEFPLKLGRYDYVVPCDHLT